MESLHIDDETKKEIVKYVEGNQPTMYWDADFSKGNLKKILSDGIDDYIDNLIDANWNYIASLEDGLVNEVCNMFPEHNKDEIQDLVMEHVVVDYNTEELIKKIPNIQVLVKIYSNYDCCNSYDDPDEEDTYLYDVYNRVKGGVKKEDYIYEFQNGVYGGCVFCFGFMTTVSDYLNQLEKMKDAESITIKAGTQFGFHSTFQGSSTLFKKVTFQDFTIPIKGETSCDYVGMIADISQGGYSLHDVYGSDILKDGVVVVNKKPGAQAVGGENEVQNV